MTGFKLALFIAIPLMLSLGSLISLGPEVSLAQIGVGEIAQSALPAIVVVETTGAPGRGMLAQTSLMRLRAG